MLSRRQVVSLRCENAPQCLLGTAGFSTSEFGTDASIPMAKENHHRSGILRDRPTKILLGRSEHYFFNGGVRAHLTMRANRRKLLLSCLGSGTSRGLRLRWTGSGCAIGGHYPSTTNRASFDRSSDPQSTRICVCARGGCGIVYIATVLSSCFFGLPALQARQECRLAAW